MGTLSLLLTQRESALQRRTQALCKDVPISLRQDQELRRSHCSRCPASNTY